jgi:hypothetical protein
MGLGLDVAVVVVLNVVDIEVVEDIDEVVVAAVLDVVDEVKVVKEVEVVHPIVKDNNVISVIDNTIIAMKRLLWCLFIYSPSITNSIF